MTSTLSVRDVAERCLGITGDLSVDTDLYGYVFRDTDGSVFGTLQATDVLPGSGTSAQPTARSLKRHLETVSGTSVDLTIFLVGHESDFSGAVSHDHVSKAQYSVQVARDLYANVDLGIRKLEWCPIEMAEAGDFVDIGGQWETFRLTANFTGPPGSLDVFLVQTIDGAGGLSPTGGTCDKDEKVLETNTTGLVVPLSSPRQWLGISLAHEIGHYLGLRHETTVSNLMCGDRLFVGSCDGTLQSTQITASQADTMKDHCFVHPACAAKTDQ
jgi:Metallo-peptidase family M12B Reprolysin-like